jgi:hypothetical protein
MDYFSTLQEKHKDFLINGVPEIRLRICHLQINDEYDASHRYFWSDSFSDGVARIRVGVATLEDAARILYPFKYLDSERDFIIAMMTHFCIAHDFIDEYGHGSVKGYVESDGFYDFFAKSVADKKHYGLGFDIKQLKAVNDAKIFCFDISGELDVLSMYCFEMVGRVEKPKVKTKLNKLHLQKEAILEEIKIQKMNPMRVNKKALKEIFLEKYKDMGMNGRKFEQAWQSLRDDGLVDSEYAQKGRIKK